MAPGFTLLVLLMIGKSFPAAFCYTSPKTKRMACCSSLPHLPHRLHRARTVIAATDATFKDEDIPIETVSGQQLQRILSKATNLFPLFVIGASVLGVMHPTMLSWFSNRQIELALGVTMICMGSTLSLDDFKNVQLSAVAVGFCAQFIIMPSMAVLAARIFRLSPIYAAGLILVGCCPGGTASNLVTLIAGADVALSVAMTSASTVMASVMTPLLASALAGAVVPISGKALVGATARVVLLPVAAGMSLRGVAPRFATTQLSTVAPPLCVALVALICGAIVAQNAPLLRGATAAFGGAQFSSPVALTAAVATMHLGGFALGYSTGKAFGLPSRVCRTVSIETGMQNSALGTVLAMRALSADAAASSAATVTCGSAAALPGAISATVHSCIGSVLAGIWRMSDAASSSSTSSSSPYSDVKTWSAFKNAWKGDMRKRDFLKSRVMRIAKRINKNSACISDDECLLEIDDVDPVDITMALKNEVGDKWWLRRRLAWKIFGREKRTTPTSLTSTSPVDSSPPKPGPE